MTLPASVTLKSVHVKVVDPATGVAAKGHVAFEMPFPLRDSAGAVILGRKTFVAELVAGEFTEPLPATDDPDLSPQGWTYTVRPVTDLWFEPPFQLSVPVATVGTLELAQHAPAVTPDEVATYALLGHVHGTAQITGLDTALDALADRIADLEDAPAGGGGAGLPTLFNVEDPAFAGGAAGDGVTDDYPAIKAAWDAMLASPTGGLVYFPRVATYRVLATALRLTPTVDEARALFPLPMRSRQLDKVAYGVLGVGDPFVVRTADLGDVDGPGQVFTASVLLVDYDTPFAWSAQTGLPCVIGAPDVDATDAAESNIFSNLHFSADGLIIRQPDNPSLCALNLEAVSTVRIGALRVDVEPVLDVVSEPTHPTGCGVLLSRSNNNVAVLVDRLIVEGQYAGASLTEHGYLRFVIALRCKIALFTRRPNSHHGEADSVRIEQCPQWISGWDPSGAGPNGGVVPVHGWSGYIRKMAGEDYAYNGTLPWLYAPVSGVHINDPNGVLGGTIGYFTRVNSEPPSPTGMGIGDGGGSSTVYVRGPSGTTASPIAIYGLVHAADATRVLPPGDEPVDEHMLFPASDGPSVSATEGSAINVGVVLDFDADVLATRLRFFRPGTNVSGAITGRLWRVTDQQPVAGSDVTFVFDDELGWIEATFADALALDPAHRYIAAVHFPDRYPRTGSFWDSGAGAGGIIAGPMTALSTNDSPTGQGMFSMGALSVYPGNSGNGADYGVDLVIVAA